MSDKERILSGKREARDTGPVEMKTVSMDQVPEPPVWGRVSRWEAVYVAARAVLRKRALRDGLQMLSSREEDSTTGYFWLVKPEKP